LSSGTRAHEEGMSSNRQLVRDGEALTLDELTVRRWGRDCVWGNGQHLNVIIQLMSKIPFETEIYGLNSKKVL